MHLNKTTGIISIVIGIAIIVLSFYTSGAVAERVGAANRKAEAMTNNPITRQGGPATEIVGGEVRNRVRSAANERARPYETAVFWGYIIGGCLVVLGGGVVAYSSRKKG